VSVSVSGPELFARYAYPPNDLGYCGPDDPLGLLAAGTPEANAEIGRRARAFEGAWVYLELIAAATGIADPLDARVVEAYWVGNELLDQIEPGWFLGWLRKRFHGQSGGQWASGIPDLDGAVRPHHGFHVFAIYPWVGLLSDDSDVPRSILDQCRIKIGTVTSVDGELAVVSQRPLTWDGQRLGIGPAQDQSVRWSEAGRSLLEGVSVGDRVSIHWDWICDVLSPAQADALESSNARQLEVTNHQLSRRS
jgi:hypothetical protein